MTVNAPAAAALVDEHAPDVVVNTLPGRIGHGIRSGCSSGLCRRRSRLHGRGPGVLHDLAVQHGGRLVWDIGVAPGMSNLLLAEGVRRHGRLTRGRVRVGGNPVNTDEVVELHGPFSLTTSSKNTRGPLGLCEMAPSSRFRPGGAAALRR